MNKRKPMPEERTESIPGFVDGKVSDSRMLARAIIERWPIDQKYREAIIARLTRIAIDPNSTKREVMVASKALIAADALNVKQELQGKAQKHEVLHHGQVSHMLSVDRYAGASPDAILAAKLAIERLEVEGEVIDKTVEDIPPDPPPPTKPRKRRPAPKRKHSARARGRKPKKV